METVTTPDWHRSMRDLEWSWRKATERHRQALALQKDGQEDAGFDLLLNIQHENLSVQEDYRACRAVNGDRFWAMASAAGKTR
jgi:hypothetical protein